MTRSADIVIIGSGMGGATMAAALAPTGAEILILERGERIAPGPETRDQRAIFHEGRYRPDETWDDAAGRAFNPGNYAVVGGNSKFYGAVLIRYRAEDFEAVAHSGGLSPAWPMRYAEIEPWYASAETLFQVRGARCEDPTEPPRSTGYPHPPVPDEPAIADVRARLASQGLSPFSLPLGVDIETWLSHGATPWDAHPDARSGKMDAETCALAAALSHPNVRLETGATATRLETAPDGRRIEAVHVAQRGETRRIAPKLVVLAAGAVRSAALLLGSADARNPAGLANRSDQVGRRFMNHNATAMLALHPTRRNRSVYQKTLGFNDFYLNDGAGGPPLGQAQLLGKVSGTILKARLPWMPQAALDAVASRSVDWYLMTEDLPDPESRVTLNGGRIRLDWRRTNLDAHRRLVARVGRVMRRAGWPIILTQRFDGRTPSHQCGTIHMGDDPAAAPVDAFGRAHDHPNLFVADASLLPTSAAVNPALTVAALALRAGAHIAASELRAAETAQ